MAACGIEKPKENERFDPADVSSLIRNNMKFKIFSVFKTFSLTSNDEIKNQSTLAAPYSRWDNRSETS